jgi:DNA polymerase-3 subunit epsilon
VNNRTRTIHQSEISHDKEILVLVDVETTGMRADTSRIIDVGIIRIENGIIVEKFESFVNPGMSIPPSITLVNGITDEDVAEAPTFEEISDTISRLFEGGIFVAHNASFDYGFLKREFGRIGVAFSAPVLCTVKLSRALFPKARSHSLDALIRRHKFSCTARHRAMPDAEVMAQFLDLVNVSFEKDHVARIKNEIVYSTFELSQFHKQKMSDLPDSPGVYFFYDKDDGLLYVGKSKHIRTRVKSHFRPDAERGEKKMISHIARIETTKTSGELSALLLESHLIKKELPYYNRLLRKRKEMVVVTLAKDDNGYAVPVIEKRPSILETDSVISVFRSITQARAKLRTIAREHALCEKLLGTEKTDRSCFGMSLGWCHGACVGKEDPASYNKRFGQAFKRRRVKTWPFSGGVIIDEKGSSGTGCVFFVKKWRICGSYQYENGVYEEFIPKNTSFDFDTYKLLARFILDPANRRCVQVLSDLEFERSLRECSVDSEEELEYSFGF